MAISEKSIAFQSGALTLEGVLHIPNASGPWPGVVICHPHPRHGGEMNSCVVTAIARGLSEAGTAALRFNFRGVGNSEGAYSQGTGEAEDAAAAVSFLTLDSRIRAGHLGIAGYSFGAWIALEIASRNGLVQVVASVACPTTPFTALGAEEMVAPKLLVCGDQDHDFPVGQFEFLAKRYAEPKQVAVLFGADHFFRGREGDVAALTTEFFSRWLAGDASGVS